MVDWIRRRHRKRLLACLLAPSLAAVVYFGWRASLARRADEQEAIMRSIAQLGGRFSLDSDYLDPPAYGPPQWLQALVGRHYFSNVVSVNLGTTRLDDAYLGKLASLDHLQSLGIWQTHVNDAGLTAILRLAELETLDISQTDITDEGLRQLMQLGSMRVLVVGGDRLTDQGLEHLKQMSKLNLLCVVGNQFSLPAKQRLEQSLPDTTVVFVPVPQMAVGAARGPIVNPAEPTNRRQPPRPPATPGKKLLPVQGQFT